VIKKCSLYNQKAPIMALFAQYVGNLSWWHYRWVDLLSALTSKP